MSSVPGEATPERRGRAKRFFKVQALGVRALRDALATLDRMRKGIKEFDHPIGAET